MSSNDHNILKKLMWQEKIDNNPTLRASLPSSGSAALRALTEGARPRMANLARVLEKCGLQEELGIADGFEQTLQQAVSSRAALLRLPGALAGLQGMLRNIQHPFAAKILAEGQSIVHGVVIELAALVARQYNLDANKGYLLVGEGAYNWAVADPEHLIFISRGDTDAFNQYRLRRWCGERLNAAGLEQPRIRNLGRLPVPHAISEWAPGETMGDILWNAKVPSANSDAIRRRDQGLHDIGVFLRRMMSVEVNGFGKLERTAPGVFAGPNQEFDHPLRRFSRPFQGRPADSGILQTLMRAEIVTGQDVRFLSGQLQEISSRHFTPILMHADPNPWNFLYDPSSRTVTVLDWDWASGGAMPEALAQVYESWVLWCAPEIGEGFTAVLRGFEPDDGKREALYRQLLQFSALRTYLDAWWRVEQGTELERLPVLGKWLQETLRRLRE